MRDINNPGCTLALEAREDCWWKKGFRNCPALFPQNFQHLELFFAEF
jgi:hypothetical protein